MNNINNNKMDDIETLKTVLTDIFMRTLQYDILNRNRLCLQTVYVSIAIEIIKSLKILG